MCSLPKAENPYPFREFLMRCFSDVVFVLWFVLLGYECRIKNWKNRQKGLKNLQNPWILSWSDNEKLYTVSLENKEIPLKPKRCGTPQRQSCLNVNEGMWMISVLMWTWREQDFPDNNFVFNLTSCNFMWNASFNTAEYVAYVNPAVTLSVVWVWMR